MRKAFALATVVSALLLSVTPAAASQPLSVTIDVFNLVEDNVIVSSQFFAVGPAVDAGLICGSGTVTDDSSSASGPPDWQRQNFNVVKHFECDDDSGSFTARLSVHAIFDPEFSVTGQWDVLEGTGNYAALHGAGSLVATWDTDSVLHDVYTGSVHID